MVPAALKLAALLCALAGMATASGAQSATLEPVPEGRVRFYAIADADFDRFSKRPTVGQQRWMREHYARMQTYSPYFDSRLAWYPDAWAYKDSYAIKPHWDIFRSHPEWVLRDAGGRMLFIPWGCGDGSCPQFAADVGNPDFRAHWISEARALLAKGYRGLWVDDVNLTWRISDGQGNRVLPIDPRTQQTMTLDTWRNNFATFMEEIRAAFPDTEIAHNSIWYADEFDAPAVVRQIRAADFINLERGATDPGLKGGDGRWGFERLLGFVDAVHRLGRGIILMDYGNNETEREYALAAWLMISSGSDLISTNQVRWMAPGYFWQGYGTNLQNALGERYRWQGLLRRDFRCGFVLLNQPQAADRTVELPVDSRSLKATPLHEVTLRAAEARVVLLPCGADGDPEAR